MRTVKFAAVLCAALISLQGTAVFAQSFSVLHAFNTNKDGQLPSCGVTLYNGTFYGTTFQGDNGSGYDSGTIYTISTNGSAYSILYSFSGSDGQNPTTLPIVSGGFIYGTTESGGSNFDGVIYRLSLTGTNNTFNVLHTFDGGAGGSSPRGDLLLSGGTLYGTTAGGITNTGAVYSIDTIGGSFTVLHSFTNTDGAQPSPGQLVLSGSTIYGATTGGGANNYGVIYSVGTNGSNFTVLHTFSAASGGTPAGNLVLSGNTLYGTAEVGGSNGFGAVFAIGTDGNNYRQLYAFEAWPDGEFPFCTLALSSNALFGTTDEGGSGSSGTIFSINTDGTGYQSLYSFSGSSPGPQTNADGFFPQGTVLLSGTNLYGVAPQGGLYGEGTLFQLVVPTAANVAPTITVQPQNEAVIVGSNMTLTVTASGIPAPTYQWQLNGTNINLATDSSYTVTNAQSTCAGNYSVIVSNSAGSVVSSNGYLAVATAPFFYAEVSLGGQWCWLDQDNDTNHIFGYFNYSPNTFPFLFHIDLGEEYFFDANNANSGGYFYDFGDGVFFYTEPGLFPYLYDFHLNTWVYYDPDPTVGYGRYTSSPRWFYNFTANQWINHL